MSDIIFGTNKAKGGHCSRLIYKGKLITINKGASNTRGSLIDLGGGTHDDGYGQKLYSFSSNIKGVCLGRAICWKGCEQYKYINDWIKGKKPNSLKFMKEDIDYEKKIISWLLTALVEQEELVNIFENVKEESFKKGYDVAKQEIRKALGV